MISQARISFVAILLAVFLHSLPAHAATDASAVQRQAEDAARQVILIASRPPASQDGGST